MFDVHKRQLNLELPADEIAARLANWQPPAPHYTRGVMFKYATLVTSASRGAVTS